MLSASGSEVRIPASSLPLCLILHPNQDMYTSLSGSIFLHRVSGQSMMPLLSLRVFHMPVSLALFVASLEFDKTCLVPHIVYSGQPTWNWHTNMLGIKPSIH